MKLPGDDGHGYETMRQYLSPREETPQILLQRSKDILYIMKSWERKLYEKYGKQLEVYCYCKQINDETRGMIGCDGCQEWFHLSCAGLAEDFSSLQDWYCKNCAGALEISEVCICNSMNDPDRRLITCKGKCKGEYHPECFGLDVDNMELSEILRWKCANCT